MYIEIIKSLKERAKEMLEDNYDRKIGDEEIYTIICELENFYTAYEKEKEKNKELENRNRELNIIRLEFLVSQFPDTTETYKKYKKELDEAISNLKEE